MQDAKERIELYIMTKEDKKIWDVNIESGKEPTRTRETLCRSALYLLYVLFILLLLFLSVFFQMNST